MKHTSTLATICVCFSIVRAAPSLLSRASSQAPISKLCNNAQLRGNWLIADCLTDDDDDKRVTSAVFLSNKAENSDGDLKWKADGNFFRSCKDCTLAESGSTLSCSCKTAYGSKKGAYTPGTLNLDEHIAVYNGHLLSNLTGAPIIPSENSQQPVPSSFSYSFGGIASCPDQDHPDDNEKDYCKTGVTSQCTPSDRSNTQNLAFTFEGPVNCYVPVIYFPQYHYQFEVLKLAGEGAWELLGYADESCSGKPVETVKSQDMGKCNKFGTKVKAVTVRPAFNGDAR